MKKIFFIVLMIQVYLFSNTVEGYIYPIKHDTEKTVQPLINDWVKKIGNKKPIFIIEGFEAEKKLITGPNFRIINGESIRKLFLWIMEKYPGTIYGGDDLSFSGRDFEIIKKMNRKKRVSCKELRELLSITSRRGQKMIDTIENFILEKTGEKDDYVIIGFMGKAHFPKQLPYSNVKLIWLEQFHSDWKLDLYNKQCNNHKWIFF